MRCQRELCIPDQADAGGCINTIDLVQSAAAVNVRSSAIEARSGRVRLSAKPQRWGSLGAGQTVSMAVCDDHAERVDRLTDAPIEEGRRLLCLDFTFIDLRFWGLEKARALATPFF
jgi:hypothetical protein